MLVAGGCGALPKPPPPPPKPIKPRPYSIPTPPRPGLHGSALVSTKVLPGLRELATDRENTVTATTKLGFAVTIENRGEWPESNFRLTLTIQQAPDSIVQTQLVPAIRPGERKTLAFRRLGQVEFATRTTVKVDIQPVPGEENTANNSAQYPTIFSLG
jgi:hypothetical protein